jgi:4-amino-4-deoxy-L-arabinose transferase-like glycosyltransferase
LAAGLGRGEIHSLAQKVATVSSTSITFFPDTPGWRWLLLGFLLLSAFAIRVVDLKRPPIDFHPTRQYHSALLAHAYYLEFGKSIPDWQREVIQVQRKEMGVLEPPLFEFLVAQFYKLAGIEALWIPRLWSIVFWLSGGIAVFLIGLRLGSLDVAVLASAFFLFLPFGISASRSFQPDILMLMLLLWALYLLLGYHDSSDLRRLFWTAAVGGLATLVKPQGVFMLLLTAVFLIGYQNERQRRHLTFFLVIVVLPALLYYGYHLIWNQKMQQQATSSFIPQLWFKVYYWQFWLKHLWRVIGFSALVGGALGIFLIPAGWRRDFIIAMWLGYAVFGLFYNYHIHTHNYYHLQFIPAVALALGFLGANVLQQLILVAQNQLQRVLIGCILLFSIFLNMGLYLNTLSEAENLSSQAHIAEQIGQIVNHSARTLFLAPYYGAPLEYYGELAGNPWPTIGDSYSEQLVSGQLLTAEERLDQFFQDSSPEYFIVTDIAEYQAQTELQKLLSTHFSVIAQSEEFIIFDLRQRL